MSATDFKLEPATVVTGMHRSGTSMVTQLLAHAGLWLGPEEKLMPAKPDNPDGFYEHLDVVWIHNALLQQHHGGWDFEPTFTNNWQQAESISDLKSRAISTCKKISSGKNKHQAWGWKDPRTCFFLPFWHSLMPDMKHVICVRNPLAVAQSIRARNNNSLPFGLDLWERYNSNLLNHVRAGSFVVTHYDSWFIDPQKELLRLTRFLGWEAQKIEEPALQTLIKPSYRHHQTVTLDDLHTHCSPSVLQLYDRLCEQAEIDFA